MSDRARCVDTITTSKRLECFLNLLIPMIHNAIHLEVVPHMHLTTCYKFEGPFKCYVTPYIDRGIMVRSSVVVYTVYTSSDSEITFA